MTKQKEKTPKPEPVKKNFNKKTLVNLALLMVGAVLIFLIFQLVFWQRIYPAIFVSETNLTALTKDQAVVRVDQTLGQRLKKPLTFSYYPATDSSQAKPITINLDETSIEKNTAQEIEKAFLVGRTHIYKPFTKLTTDIKFTPSFEKQLDQIAQSINQSPIDATLKFDGDQISVTPSQNGLSLDKPKLKELIANYLNTNQLSSIALPIKEVSPKLSYQQALQIKKSLDQIKLKPINLTFQNQTWQLDLSQVISFLDIEKSNPSLVSGNILNTPFAITSINIGEDQITDSQLNLDEVKINQYLLQIEQEVNQPLKEPLFSFDGSKVIEFQPPQEGRSLDTKKTASLISQSILSGQAKDISLPVLTTQPKNKLVNDLGIKELVSEGVSNFAHSIPNRIFNVTLAASKINGVLIPPGEVFSFNQTVGDITAATGFKQAYVIKSGRTVLDDGGGVCQVSTTLFRAALNAGLPIVQRTAHAYRVEYYEQGFPPGLDATTYYPSVDLKFKNDTPSHILIQTKIEGTTLWVDFYGTSDGRVVNLTKPIIHSQTPPLPEIRQDDPTLPKGTVKQVDFPAWGANISFKRTVIKNGQTLIDESFRSNYRPWQAVYLVGTKEN